MGWRTAAWSIVGTHLEYYQSLDSGFDDHFVWEKLIFSEFVQNDIVHSFAPITTHGGHLSVKYPCSTDIPRSLSNLGESSIISRSKALDLENAALQKARSPSSTLPVSVVCISDPHNTDRAPHGDILVHSGDSTSSGTLGELQRALTWLRAQPHEHKIIIGGNHGLRWDPKVWPRDMGEYSSCESLDWSGLTYLNGESITIEVSGRKLKVYGSPWTPQQGNRPSNTLANSTFGIIPYRAMLIFSLPTVRQMSFGARQPRMCQLAFRALAN
jgi:hypothetical protein